MDLPEVWIQAGGRKVRMLEDLRRKLLKEAFDAGYETVLLLDSDVEYKGPVWIQDTVLKYPEG